MTAEQARRQVKGWLLDQVSYMMTAKLPTLVIGTSVVWRVPVILTATHVGHVGVVGEVDVDVETGALHDLSARKAAILAQASKLATTIPPYQPPTTTPQAWLAKGPKPTHPTGQPVGNPLDLLPTVE